MLRYFSIYFFMVLCLSLSLFSNFLSFLQVRALGLIYGLLLLRHDIYDTVHDHTKTVIPQTKMTASCGLGGHFPPFVGAIRLIHLGACFRSFQFKCESSISSSLT